MTQGGRIPNGRRVHSPELARQAEIRRQDFHDSIYGFVDELPIGQSGDAAEVVGYEQPDGVSCFYAALGGVATALHGRVIDIRALSARSRGEELLDQYGAKTFPEFQAAQQAFVRREMNINISFINALTDPDHERLHAVTRGLREGRHILFGLPGHWVALDGFRKYSSGATWTGMNPSGARRIGDEQGQRIGPQVIVDRLLEGDMPVVTAEGTNQRRWPGRAEASFENPRRVRRAEEPLFDPRGRRIKRAQE